ncbi:unnamed protein product, partial [Ectocarpus sp. 4 AP-2014]
CCIWFSVWATGCPCCQELLEELLSLRPDGPPPLPGPPADVSAGTPPHEEEEEDGGGASPCKEPNPPPPPTAAPVPPTAAADVCCLIQSSCCWYPGVSEAASAPPLASSPNRLPAILSPRGWTSRDFAPSMVAGEFMNADDDDAAAGAAAGAANGWYGG